MLYRLKEIGSIGKILDISKSMYKSPKVSLIHQDKISQTFLTTIDLKQGDVLSTILFNIYINDLPLMSKEDLQKRISILEQYSNEWGLELNLSKTKIMIFNKQGATIRKFKF